MFLCYFVCSFFTDQSPPYKVSQKDEEDEDAITEFCEDLYMSSAKSNITLDDIQSMAYGVIILSMTVNTSFCIIA